MAISAGGLRRRLHRLGEGAAGVRHAFLAAERPPQTCLRGDQAREREGQSRLRHRLPAGALGPHRARAAARTASSPSQARHARSCRRSLPLARPRDRHRGGDSTSPPAARTPTEALQAHRRRISRSDPGREARPAGLQRSSPARQSFDGKGFPVEVFNILGAGDGFAAGFLSGWLRDLPLEECARRANACGALVVSRHGCAPAMPSKAELELFLSRSDWPFRLRDSAVARTTCIARPPAGSRWPEVLALAFDHRKQLEELGPPEQIRAFKRLVARRCRQLLSRGTARSSTTATARRRCSPSPAAACGSRGRSRCPAAGRWSSRPARTSAAKLRAWPAEHVVKCLFAFEARRPAAARRRCTRPASPPATSCCSSSLPQRCRGARRRSTPPASGRTGGSCRRPHRTPSGWRSSRYIARARPALPRRAAARHGGERGRARARLRARGAPPGVQGLRRRPLDLHGRRAALVRRRRAPTRKWLTRLRDKLLPAWSRPGEKRGSNAKNRFHRHRPDGPRHGEEPAEEGPSAVLPGPPQPLEHRGPAGLEGTRSPNAAGAGRRTPTSSSSASPARRRSRPMYTAALARRRAQGADRHRLLDRDARVHRPHPRRLRDARACASSTRRSRARRSTRRKASSTAWSAPTPPTFAEVKPVLEKFCENILHVGGPGRRAQDQAGLQLRRHGRTPRSTCESLAACAQVGHLLGKCSTSWSPPAAPTRTCSRCWCPRRCKGDLTGPACSRSATRKKDIGYYQQMVAARAARQARWARRYPGAGAGERARPRREVRPVADRGLRKDQAMRWSNIEVVNVSNPEEGAMKRIAGNCCRCWPRARRSTARGRCNQAWAQAAQKKPLVIGLTMDASGQFGASGMDERLGAMLAIREFNEKGGVLGRRIEALHMDTETTPATGSRVAERMITRNEAAFLIGAVHSGVANAISQVAQKYGTRVLQHQLELAHRGGPRLPPRQVRLGRQRHQLQPRHRQERDARERQELAAAHQRLRLGPQHLEVDARAGRGERRQGDGRADGAAEHARLQLLPAQAAADQAASDRRRGRRRRHQGAAPAGGADQARQSPSPGSTTSRTGPTSTAWGPMRCSASSAPPGTTASTCRA